MIKRLSKVLSIRPIIKKLINRLKDKAGLVQNLSFYWKRRPENASELSVVFFPYSGTTLRCGLAGLISVYQHEAVTIIKDLNDLTTLVDSIRTHPLASCASDTAALESDYLGGDAVLERLFQMTRQLKRQDHFVTLYSEPGLQPHC